MVGSSVLHFRKAFDTIDRTILLSTLLSFKLFPQTLTWMESSLSARLNYCILIYRITNLTYPLAFRKDLFSVLYFFHLYTFHPSDLILLPVALSQIQTNYVLTLATRYSYTTVDAAVYTSKSTKHLLCLFFYKHNTLTVLPHGFVSGKD